jgi:cardiolipin synthase
LQSGGAFFPALEAAIESSASEVRLETYIFHFEGVGERIARALERAALRGVAVYLLMDGIGTPYVPPEWAQRLTDAGVRWHRFSPLGRWGIFVPLRWRRLHRKLCVVDSQIAFCGGINILDDYIDPDVGTMESARFDFAVQVTGPLVADIYSAMVQFWARLVFTQQIRQLQLQEASRSLKGAVALGGMDALTTEADGGPHGAWAALVLRDNVRYRSQIERTYRKAIADARDEVLIANAYFLPGRKLRNALVMAVSRGVRVRLLLHGTYESFMQYHAARPVLGSLLAAGVEIHEYRVGFLHAKVAVVDGHWATVGSSNLDPLSLLLAREANVVVDDTQLAGELRTCVLKALDRDSVKLEAATYAARPWRERCLDQLAFALTRVLIFLSGKRY